MALQRCVRLRSLRVAVEALPPVHLNAASSSSPKSGKAAVQSKCYQYITFIFTALTSLLLPSRPYTIRKGDTLDSIANKRGLKMSDLEKYNKGLSTAGKHVFCYNRAV